MEQPTFGDLETLWNYLLSGNPSLVRLAYTQLTDSEKQSIREHLLRMANEPGWHPAQRASARIALNALGDENKSDEPALSS